MNPSYKLLARYGTVGLELVLATLLGLYGGSWLDTRFHTGNTLSMVGMVLGVATGFRALYRAAKAMEREAEEADRREPPP